MLMAVSLKSHLQILDICYERLARFGVVGWFCLYFVMTLFVFNCLPGSTMSVIKKLIIHSFPASDSLTLITWGTEGLPAWAPSLMICSDN